MKALFPAAICAALLSACAGTPRTADSSATINRTFSVLNFGTRSGDTDLVIASKAMNAGGKVRLCAAAGADGNPDFEPRWPAAILAATSFYFDEELIGRRADFGTHYPGTVEIVGRTAGCATLDAPWKPA